nr:hypothetical protein [Kibdelosporangium sp. MJ126-NF4]
MPANEVADPLRATGTRLTQRSRRRHARPLGAQDRGPLGLLHRRVGRCVGLDHQASLHGAELVHLRSGVSGGLLRGPAQAVRAVLRRQFEPVAYRGDHAIERGQPIRRGRLQAGQLRVCLRVRAVHQPVGLGGQLGSGRLVP